jgi:uncharacterized protein (UPF0548 family)
MEQDDRSELTYAEVGATRDGPLPPGYRHMRHRTLIGYGPEVMRAATDGLLEWRMQRGAGARIDTSGTRARPGPSRGLARDRAAAAGGTVPGRVDPRQ